MNSVSVLEFIPWVSLESRAKHPTYNVISKRGLVKLGTMHWHHGRKRYEFTPLSGLRFEPIGLMEIVNFLKRPRAFHANEAADAETKR